MSEFFVGSYAQAGQAGIFRVCLDERNLKLHCVSAYCCAENPSWLLLHPNGRMLYAVEERLNDGRIVALRVSAEGLTKLASFPTDGSAPCHLEMDADAKLLFVSNYMSGSLAVFSLDEAGLPLRMTDLKQHRGSGANLWRQEGPHVHSSWYRDGLLYVCDLGLDTLFCYEVDRDVGALRDAGRRICFPPGSGPRHCCHLPEYPDLLYVDAELSGDVFVLNLREQRIVQQISAIPDDLKKNFTLSAIKARDGRIYVGNRGFDSFTEFRIESDGTLRLERIVRHPHKTPRDFYCGKGYILSADQDAHQISVMRVDTNGEMQIADTCDFGEAMPSCIISCGFA